MMYILMIKDGATRIFSSYADLIKHSQKLNDMGISHTTEVINNEVKE